MERKQLRTSLWFFWSRTTYIYMLDIKHGLECFKNTCGFFCHGSTTNISKEKEVPHFQLTKPFSEKRKRNLSSRTQITPLLKSILRSAPLLQPWSQSKPCGSSTLGQKHIFPHAPFIFLKSLIYKKHIVCSLWCMAISQRFLTHGQPLRAKRKRRQKSHGAEMKAGKDCPGAGKSCWQWDTEVLSEPPSAHGLLPTSCPGITAGFENQDEGTNTAHSVWMQSLRSFTASTISLGMREA